MKNKPVYLLLISFLAVSLYSCEDVFEKNLGKKDLTILAPYNGYKSTISTITFWWEEVKGAEEYSLQVVSPSFSQINRLVVDTTITKNKFVCSLSPGAYQWRLKASNNSSSTEYLTYSFTIDSTSDLTQQTILLVSPSDYDTTNQTSFTFKWDTLYNADDYRFEIWKPDFSGTNVLSIIVQTDTFPYTLGEGKYEWGVRGENSTTNTQYTKRSIYIDTTRPNTPALQTPVNNAVLGDSTISFSWSRGTVTGSSIKDSLYIYTDSLMSNNKLLKYLNTTTYTDSLGVGSFFWRIRSIDAAGNKSNYSVLRKLKIQ